MPKSHRFSSIRWGVSAMSSIWSWYPPVGVFIAILALLGVLVPLFSDLGKIGQREKAFWTLIMFALVGLEIRSIHLDRNAHDREQADAREQQLKSFHEIASGIDATLTTSQSQFQATADRLQAAVKSNEEASKNAKPHALMTYITISPSGQIRPASAVIFPNQAFEINVQFTNSGSETAQHVLLDLQTYVAKPDDESTQDVILSAFNKWWSTSKHVAPAVDEVQPREQRFATFKSQVFSADDIKAVMDKSRTLYVLLRWTYSDSGGRWASDTCFGYQYVYQDFNVLHPCRSAYNRQRYPAPK